MTLSFETPEQRLAQLKKINILLLGMSGVGKTFAARYLNSSSTLFIDGEAGTLALGNWPAKVLNVRAEAQRLSVHPWEMCRAIACLLAGPDPKATDGPYSLDSYNKYVAALGDGLFDEFDTIYIDSATVVSRWSFDWAKKQPEAFSERKGKLDTRGTYGLHGREFVEWATQLQHQPKNIIMSCILDEKTDDFSRKVFEPQIVGGMAGRELPGIFDIVLTLAKIPAGNEQSDEQIPRWFVTQHGNQYGFPAKDRSGVLDPFEAPDLGALISKIQNANI